MPIDSKSLQLGDILITDKSNFISHCGIVAGTMEVRTGGFNAPTVTRPGMVVHATTGGIKNDEISKWVTDRGKSGVFRFTGLSGTQIDGVKADKAVCDAAYALAAACKYSKSNAFGHSWAGTSDFGYAARGRLMYQMAGLKLNNAKFISDVFCSELVVLSYQLGAKANEKAPFFIDLDGKHTLPKDLRNWLLQHTKADGKWSFEGDLTG